MINLRCPKCGFFFSVDFPDDISPEDEQELRECPCGTMMNEVDFDPAYIFEMGGEQDG